MTAHDSPTTQLDRREFLELGGLGLGALALRQLLDRGERGGGLEGGLHHAPRAKRVIQLFMAGAPSQFELFEPKPALQEHDGQAPPESLIRGQRFAFIDPARSKLMGTRRAFARHGECAHRAHRRQAVLPARALDGRDQPRAGQALPEHRLRAVRATQPGRLAAVRPRQRGRGPARLRGAALGQPRPARRLGSVVERLSVAALRGHALPRGG
jgi:hypothetical protein